MRVVRRGAELEPRGAPVCLALGFFDGVHLGHQAVLARTVLDAEEMGALPVAVTFDRHPSVVLAPERSPALIYPLERRLLALEERGMRASLLVHFDAALSRIEPEAFVRSLADEFGHIRSISVGTNFGFGHKRAGNVALLEKLAATVGYKARGIAPVMVDGEVVSSTRARQAIQAGRFDAAGALLGRPYGLAGTVVAGDQVGRQLGFPTANLDVAGLALPPRGVYAARAKLGGELIPAAVNIGIRPTVAGTNPTPRVEAHLLDFSGDIYGRSLDLIFDAKLREEIKFSSREALRRQIEEDIASARRFF
jgi:riboflavin kinase/FMN adenylyltransferase